MNPTPKATLSKPTQLLFHIAARSHTLAELFGVNQIFPDVSSPGVLQFESIPRPWLVPHPIHPDEYSFDPEKFAERLRGCSSGQRYMILWILNVWNPGLAASKGWHFDLFKCLDSLDADNREAIMWWFKNPIWP